MMKKTIFFTVLLLTIIACKSRKKLAATSTSIEQVKPILKIVETIPLTDSLYRFTVSFNSIGTGINHQAKGEFDHFILKFNEKFNVRIMPEIVKWGREGEMDYCLKLNELNTQQQNQFISQTKELLKNSSYVRYTENSTCVHKRQ